MKMNEARKIRNWVQIVRNKRNANEAFAICKRALTIERQLKSFWRLRAVGSRYCSGLGCDVCYASETVYSVASPSLLKGVFT